MDVRFRLLGPMEILVDDGPVPMPGAAERAVLVQLRLTPGRPVPATMLVARLWSESSLPVDPMNALQIRVSKLRRSLKATGVPEVVTREGAGYRANVDPTSVDAVDFVARVRAARARSEAGAGAADAASLNAYDEALATILLAEATQLRSTSSRPAPPHEQQDLAATVVELAPEPVLNL